MKLFALPVLLLFAIPQIPGCDTNKVSETLKTATNGTVDSILTKSQSNIVDMGRTSEKSDSIITEKVNTTSHKIEDLLHEVKVLKKENNELKRKNNNVDTTGAVDQHFGLLPISTDAIPE